MRALLPKPSINTDASDKAAGAGYVKRFADAHETFDESLQRLQDLGFDTASLHQGYGKALDFVMDVVIAAFVHINRPIKRILTR